MTRPHRSLAKSDEGKRSVNADGRSIGTLVRVDGGIGYVDPEPDIGDRIRSRLGWGTADGDEYPLDPTNVSEIAEDEVRLEHGEWIPSDETE